MNILLKDTQQRYSTDEYALKQFEDYFGDVSEYVAEFDPFWESVLPDVIYAHRASGVGEYAGSGCVDYNESKGLYIFTRVFVPKVIFELGYAAGISTSMMARALEVNGGGIIHTVDLSPQHWDVSKPFVKYRDAGFIKQYHTTDAIDFLTDAQETPDMTFTDATHELEPTKRIAEILLRRWPDIPHLYHEWGMSNRSGPIEKSYVGFQNHIGSQYERDAFETTFGDRYAHGGLVGSCGLGVVMPVALTSPDE